MVPTLTFSFFFPPCPLLREGKKNPHEGPDLVKECPPGHCWLCAGMKRGSLVETRAHPDLGWFGGQGLRVRWGSGLSIQESGFYFPNPEKRPTQSHPVGLPEDLIERKEAILVWTRRCSGLLRHLE